MARKKKKKQKKKGSARKQATERNGAADAPPEDAPSGDTAPVVEMHVPPAAAAEPAAPPSAPPAPARPTEPEGPVAEDLDADLDDDLDYASLVAQVAGLPDKTARPAAGPARKPAPAKPVPAEDFVEVLDLDDDEGASETIDRLIAHAVVGAPIEEVETEEEAPLIDLDVDDDVPLPRARSFGAAPPASGPPTRLVQAAAAGRMDDAGTPAVSLDLGEVSTPEARARLLAQAIAHAEHQEARYRVPLADTRQAARWKALVSGVLFVLAGAVTVAPPAWVRPEPPAQLSAAARTRDLRMALLLQAQQVEAFRVRSQRLPTGLDELPAVLHGVRYTRSGNRSYQLIAYESDGRAVVYDSANPAPPFRILMRAWVLGGAP